MPLGSQMPYKGPVTGAGLIKANGCRQVRQQWTHGAFRCGIEPSRVALKVGPLTHLARPWQSRRELKTGLGMWNWLDTAYRNLRVYAGRDNV